jgi:hypothetical protein
MIDWEKLAEDVGSRKNGQESGSRDYAQAAIERIIGVENIRQAVDHYVAGDPGSGLIRSVIWRIHPFSAMERCYEIYKHDPDLENRRMAVELLRVAADRRVLPWIEEFLNDEDQSIRAWGFGIVDQLLWSELVWENEAAHLIELAEKSSDDYLREKAVFVRGFLRERKEQWEILQKHQSEDA